MLENVNHESKKFSLEELSQLTGLSRRTIRYYIQRGLVERPSGGTKAAFYELKHLESLLHIKRLTEKHVPLDEIRDYQEEPKRLVERRVGSVDVCSHIYLGEGLTLVVNPRLSHLSSEELRNLTLKLVTVLEQFDKAEDKTHE